MFIDHFIESSTVPLSSGGSSLLPFFEPQRLADRVDQWLACYSMLYKIKKLGLPDLLSRKKIPAEKMGYRGLRKYD